MINNLFKVLCIAAITQCCVANGMKSESQVLNTKKVDQKQEVGMSSIYTKTKLKSDLCFKRYGENLFEFIFSMEATFCDDRDREIGIPDIVGAVLCFNISEKEKLSLQETIKSYLQNPNDIELKNALRDYYTTLINNALDKFIMSCKGGITKEQDTRAFLMLMASYNLYEESAAVLKAGKDNWFEILKRSTKWKTHHKRQQISDEYKLEDNTINTQEIKNDDYITYNITEEARKQIPSSDFRRFRINFLMRWLCNEDVENWYPLEKVEKEKQKHRLFLNLDQVKSMFFVDKICYYKADLKTLVYLEEDEIAACLIAVGAVSQIKIKAIETWFKEMCETFINARKIRHFTSNNLFLQFGMEVSNYMLDLLEDQIDQNWFIRKWIQYYSEALHNAFEEENLDITFKNLYNKNPNIRQKAAADLPHDKVPTY